MLVAAAPVPAGAWRLDCSGTGRGCVLRASTPFFTQGAITADLEVMSRHGTLIPVLVLRGVSEDLLTMAALAGSADVMLRFDDDIAQPLDCTVTALGYVCAPGAALGQHLAQRLETARTATAQVKVTMQGVQSPPPQQHRVAIAGTRDALARLRLAGAVDLPSPAPARLHMPGDLMSAADRLLKAAGYADGIAGAQALLEKYRRR